MNCGRCGHPIPEGSAFCPECGFRVQTGLPPVIIPENPNGGKGKAAAPAKKRSLLWLIPVVLLVLAGGVLTWLALRRQNRDKPADPADNPGAVLQTDAQGNPVQPTDAQGNPVQPTDAAGNPVAPTEAVAAAVFDCGAPAEEVEFMPEAQPLGADGLIQIPPYPVREGYVFGGWYADDACTEPFDFTVPRTEAPTVYARWIDETAEEAQLTEEEWNIFQSASEEFDRRTASYFDENGYVAEENVETVLDIVEAYAAELKQNGTITYYNREHGVVYMEFSSLIPYIFYPSLEGRDGSGDNVIVSVDPLADEVFQDSGKKRGEFCRERAEEIAAVVPISESNHYANGGADYLELKDVPDCEYFLWHGHGIFLNELHSILVTGGTYDTMEYLKLFFGLEMSESGWIRGKNFCGMNGNRIGITGNFFRTISDFSLPNGLVYLAACHSGQDSYLAQAFLDHGAEVVFGCTDSIWTTYDRQMMTTILRYMCGKGNMLTLSDQFSENAVLDRTDPVCYPALEALNKAQDWQYCMLAQHGAEYVGCDYSVTNTLEDGTWVLTYGQSMIECFGDSRCDYTIVPGVKGSLKFPEASVNTDAVTVLLSNGQTGEAYTHVTDEFGNPTFYVNNVEPGTYSVEIRYYDTPIWTKNNVEVVRHRYTDLGLVEVPVHTVRGRFLDAETREPVQAALNGADREICGAQEDGSFECALPEGSWVLTAAAEGYLPRQIPCDVPVGQGEIDLGDLLLDAGYPAMTGPVVSDGTSTYYWKYTSESHLESGLYAEFSVNPNQVNQLIRSTDGRETVVLEDSGEGELCLANGRIYYERVSGAGYNVERTVCSAAPDGSDVRRLQKGWINGVSSDGQYVLVGTYETGRSSSYDTETGTWIELPKGTAGLLTVYKDRIYYPAEVSDNGLSITSVAFDGTDVRTLDHIAKSDVPDNEYAMGSVMCGEIRFPTVNGTEYIAYTYGFIGGTTGYFSPGGFAYARLDGRTEAKDRVRLSAEAADYILTGSGLEPVFQGETRISSVFYDSIHWWYVQDGKVCAADLTDGSGTELVSTPELPDFFRPEYTLGAAQGNYFWSVTEVTQIGSKVYFRAEQSVRDPEHDLGWREAYTFQKGALFVKDRKTGKVEIVYTYGGGVDVMIEKQDIFYTSKATGYQIPMEYDLVIVEGNSEATRRINEAILEDFHQFQIAGNEEPVDEDRINRERHGWMYPYLNSSSAKDFIENPGIFPATVTAKVTCNRDGLLSVRYDATYYFDYRCTYGMTFDVQTGALLTVSALYPDRIERIESMLRSGNWITDHQRGALNAEVLQELTASPDLDRMDYYLEGRELILISPRLQYGDGSVFTFEIPCGAE